ncbi:MAG: AAA family ATPase [archaeon]|nr:AAA family ATPase [archaeon]
MVGLPGVGKSSFFKNVFAPLGYHQSNRDTLGTQAKCLHAARQALTAGHSVVVDNTNMTVDQRTPFVVLAKACGASVRCIVLQTPIAVAQLLNSRREGSQCVPILVYRHMLKTFEDPTLVEGFSSILVINNHLASAVRNGHIPPP